MRPWAHAILCAFVDSIAHQFPQGIPQAADLVADAFLRGLTLPLCFAGATRRPGPVGRPTIQFQDEAPALARLSTRA